MQAFPTSSFHNLMPDPPPLFLRHCRRLAALVVVAAALSLVDSPAGSLLGYYDFEGNYNDASGNGNDAAVAENAAQLSFVAGGMSGQAVDINDPDGPAPNTGGAILIPIDANPPARPAITFGGWVNVESSGFDGFMAMDNGGWDRGITVGNNTGAQGFGIASGGAPDMVGTITPGSWQYVVGSFNQPGSTTLYVGDDDPATQTTLSTTGSDATSSPFGLSGIELGRYDNQDLDGLVDDIFVFEGELDPHQVNAIRNLRLSTLDYSPADAAEIFDLFDARGAGIVQGISWEPTGGLTASVPGRLTDLGGGNYTLVLADNGDGMATGTSLFDPTDSDGDSMGDNWETFYFGDLSRDGTLDLDSDGLIDADEWTERTDPTRGDTDGDGLTDGQEIAAGTDPRDTDSDDDSYSDSEELIAGTDPNDPGSNPGTIPQPPPPTKQFTPFSPPSPRDSVVVFNEIHYHPGGDNTALEYIELYNQMAPDVDLSNWRIGGVDFDFPEGTVLGGWEYLVIAKDPGALQAATGFAGALGPFAGNLSNSGEPLRLYNNNRSFRSSSGAGSTGAVSESLEARRIMDEIAYADVFPWPVGADGSGSTLAKRDPTTGTPHPANWAASPQTNGTPGTENAFPATPAISFNELAAADDANFRFELVNHGSTPITLGGMVIASSEPGHTDYVLPAGSLAAGAYRTIDSVELGFSPADNNRLLLYSVGRVALLDAARVDDRPQARTAEGTGRWARPDAPTFGAPNSFNFNSDVVINEIFYHAYPQRSAPGTPPSFVDTPVLEFNSVWRFEENAGAAGLPLGWEDAAHPDWPSGPGLLAQETSELGEPLGTDIDLAPPTVTYYFETEFNHAGGAVDQLAIEHYLDDGAVFYLNGTEIQRVNIPAGPVTPSTLADPGVSDASLGRFTVANPNLNAGSNRLSVEVHQSSAGSSDVVFGARALLRTLTPSGNPPVPYLERDEEWIELFNRGGAAVDLTGWGIDGGISYNFPTATSIPPGGYLVVAKDAAALGAKHPSATIIGDYSGRLGNGGDLIVLEDAAGNPADEVVYHDSGNWHDAADGGGSSLELRDPDADNTVAESWSPSDAAGNSTWQTYSYEDVAMNDGQGNNVYYEFLLGMLDSGELLIDDISVIEDPDGSRIEFIQNGDFENDTVGANADKWRALGTHGSHGRTVVVTDPDDPGNRCLHVVASGPTEDKHNKLETTFANGERVVVGQTYRITFRAKWLSGSNQVNTRLYFSYVQRTHNLDVPEIWGTPGEDNSKLEANAGPSITDFQHAPVVPDAGQSVSVFAKATDPDGVANLTLFYSVNAGAFQPTAMSDTGGGLFGGNVPGQSASRIVRFYVRAEDSAGGISFFPPGAEEGGAFYKVHDGFADNGGTRHNFRIVMAEADRSFLFLNTNRLSNDRFPVTVIEDEKTAYYDVGLRLKASGFGRFNSSHYGFNIRFHPDKRFRGVHQSISVERSGDLKEILAKHLMNRAGGGYWSFYDDVAHIITPTTGDRGVGLLSMARHTTTFWDGLFPNASEPGTLFNQELLYNPNGTNGGPEGLKIGNPYNHTGGRYDLRDRGTAKEPYRWGFQIRSARGRDDYSQMITLNQALGTLSGAALKDALDPIIDVNQWMRTFAMMSLNGTDDVYSRIWEHNFRYYVRPSDQRIIILQWDLDRSFQLGTSSSITPDRNNVVKIFSIPQYRRMFDGHLEDLIKTTFNSSYVSPWANHFNRLTGASNQTSYINNRANFALGTLPSDVSFAITTNGGSDFSVADSVIDLAGDGWVDVFSIEVNGVPTPVDWTDANSWQITIPIDTGENLLTLTAINNHGIQVGGDTITVTNTSTTGLADAGNTILSEFHYHPAGPDQTEIDAGFADPDLFEFVELTNTGNSAIDFTNVAFTDGVEFTFPVGTMLAPNARLIVVASQAAFELRYGLGSATIAGEYTGNLRNSGEHIRLEAADTSPIADFTYGDAHPWPESGDGVGYSLIFVGTDPADPLHWRPSTTIGGNPGSTDSVPFAGGDLIAYALASAPAPLLAGDEFLILARVILGADAAEVIAQFSTDLASWTDAPPDNLISRTNHGDGTATLVFSSPLPGGTLSRQSARLVIKLR